jgi:outer membrane protein TolC
MTMRRIGLMQDIPNSGKRRAQKAVAAAAVDQAQAEQRLQRAAVRTAAAQAWLERYYAGRRRLLLDALGQENRLLADTVRATLAGGRGLPADAIGPQQEAAELGDRLDALQADEIRARATLRQLIGADADQPLQGEAPDFTIDAAQLRAQLASHPELAAYEPRLAQANAALRAAQAERRPDWGVELAYARRAAAFDDMVSLQFTVSLPLFAGARQNPAIGARRLELQQLTSAREQLLREHAAALDSDLADLVLLDRQLDRVRQTRLPLARQKVALQLASYQGGKTELPAVLAARRELIDVEFLQLELQDRRAALAARIQYSYVETAP